MIRRSRLRHLVIGLFVVLFLLVSSLSAFSLPTHSKIITKEESGYRPLYEVDRDMLQNKYDFSKIGDVDDDPSDFQRYYTYEEMERDLKSLTSQHSDIAQLHQLTRTYDGHYVYAVKISDEVGTQDPEEPDVLLIGAHHAREWPSFEAPMYFLFHILENYGTCARATWLVHNREIWVIPMLNPDGVVYDMETGGGSWRKNREPNYLSQTVGIGPLPDPKLVPVSYGTDLNRNYEYRWGFLGGSNPHLSFVGNYPGPPDNKDDDGDGLMNEDPVDLEDNDRDGKVDEDTAGGFSTAETRVIRDLAEANDFVVSLSFHTYSELILWPWGWTDEPTPDDEIFVKLGTEMGRMTNYTPQQAYELYPVDGDSDDWLYAIHGVYAFTIEMCQEFIPPDEEVLEFSQLNLGPQLFLAEVADNPSMEEVEIIHEPLDNVSEPVDFYPVKAIINDPYQILNMTTEGLPHMEEEKGGMELYYRVDGGEFKAMEMALRKAKNGTPFYEADIPSQREGSTIDYYFSFTDPRGVVVSDPKYSPYSHHTFSIKTVEIEFTLSLTGAIITAVLILSACWGGFAYTARMGFIAERRKEELYG